MKYSIRYITEYRYDSPVYDQHNALRVRPAVTANQRVDAFEVRVDPAARLHSYTDYFGTEVIEFNLIEGHERLSIEARARVTNERPPDPATGPWAALDTPEYREAAGEFLLPAGEQPSGPALDELATAVRRDTPAETLQALTEAIPGRFEYKKGATYVGSTVQDLLTGGAGRLPGLRAPGPGRCSARTASRRATCRATCSRRPRRATTRPRSRPTPGWRRCCPPPTARSRRGPAPTPPTGAWPASST